MSDKSVRNNSNTIISDTSVTHLYLTFTYTYKNKWNNYQTELLLKLLISIVNAELFKAVHVKCLKSAISSAMQSSKEYES